MKLPLLSISAAAKTITAPTPLFAGEVNWDLIAQAVHVYRSNQRQSGAKTKTRGDVVMTGAKWFKQKGTGNARHGAQSAPIFVGGGVSHGPTGLENWKRTLPTKMARRATQSALLAMAEKNAVSVGADLDTIESKTKSGTEFITKLNGAKKVLIIVDNEPRENVVRAFANVALTTVTRASRVNALELSSVDHVVIMQPALEALTARLTVTASKSTSSKPAKTVEA